MNYNLILSLSALIITFSYLAFQAFKLYKNDISKENPLTETVFYDTGLSAIGNNKNKNTGTFFDIEVLLQKADDIHDNFIMLNNSMLDTGIDKIQSDALNDKGNTRL